MKRRRHRAPEPIAYTHCPGTGKRCYSSRQQARRGTATVSNRTRVYFCRDCGGWHATSEVHRDSELAWS